METLKDYYTHMLIKAMQLVYRAQAMLEALGLSGEEIDDIFVQAAKTETKPS